MIHKNVGPTRAAICRFALALGVEPAIPFGCGMPIPAHVDEADLLGALVGEPIDVVRCVFNDLYVPASAEIVVEGELSRDEKAPEGSMGEYAGYNWGRAWSRTSRCITSRQLRIAVTLFCRSLSPASRLRRIIPPGAFPTQPRTCSCCGLRGLPVTMCWLTLEAANHWLVVTLPRTWRETSGIAESGAMCRRIGEVPLCRARRQRHRQGAGDGR